MAEAAAWDKKSCGLSGDGYDLSNLLHTLFSVKPGQVFAEVQGCLFRGQDIKSKESLLAKLKKF